MDADPRPVPEHRAWHPRRDAPPLSAQALYEVGTRDDRAAALRCLLARVGRQRRRVRADLASPRCSAADRRGQLRFLWRRAGRQRHLRRGAVGGGRDVRDGSGRGRRGQPPLTPRRHQRAVQLRQEPRPVDGDGQPRVLRPDDVRGRRSAELAPAPGRRPRRPRFEDLGDTGAGRAHPCRAHQQGRDARPHGRAPHRGGERLGTRRAACVVRARRPSTASPSADRASVARRQPGPSPARRRRRRSPQTVRATSSSSPPPVPRC